MKFKLFALVAWIALLGVSRVEAASITYNVDIVGSIWGSIKGTITTDGNIGSLAATDIINWNLAVVGGESVGGVTRLPSGVSWPTYE
jgi:protein gp37